MVLQIKKLHPEAVIPQYQHDNDSGMDLVSLVTGSLSSGETKLFPTGIAIALPPYTEAQVRSRSGLAAKHSVFALNSPGTIDEGYRGQITVILHNAGHNTFWVEKGMRIAQLVICPVLRPTIEVVEELSDTLRGVSGIGSTGL